MILVSGFLLHLLKAIIFNLSAQEFYDALSIRYRKPLLNLPPKWWCYHRCNRKGITGVTERAPFCYGCGATSSLYHFLICRKGGLVVQHHNEIRNAIGDLTALAWGQMRCEAVIVEAGDQHSETLIADLCVGRVWLLQAEVLLDIHVIDTDAQSYLCHTPGRVLLNAEVVNNNVKCTDACATQCAHFTPLCFLINGLTGSEAICFLKRMACRLSTR